jgi:hypothetical protein
VEEGAAAMEEKLEPEVGKQPSESARLPTLQEWLKCLKQINSVAAHEELLRVEAAIAAGMTQMPNTRSEYETNSATENS